METVMAALFVLTIKALSIKSMQVKHSFFVPQVVPQGTRCSWQSQGKISIHFVQIKQ